MPDKLAGMGPIIIREQHFFHPIFWRVETFVKKNYFRLNFGENWKPSKKQVSDAGFTPNSSSGEQWFLNGTNFTNF